MHSVVVLGDVRRHYARRGPIDPSNYRSADSRIETITQASGFPGGAFIVAEAIREAQAAGRSLPKPSALSEAELFSYDDAAITDERYGRALQWQLVERAVDGLGDVVRLDPCEKTATASSVAAPAPLSDRLRECLFSEKNELRNFDKPVRRDRLRIHLRQCPDVVVFDDLDEHFRYIEADLSNADVQEFVKDADGKSDIESLLKLQRAALSELFARFQAAEDEAESKRAPIMEPVILGSIRHRPDSIFSSSLPNNVWNRLHANSWLRDRTVVFLNAEDIRHSGRAISTGQSWEKTAQETIALLHSEPAFQPYLDFSQLVVIYGFSGALHIVRRGASIWSHTLYFDPLGDDTKWINSSSNGEVLGDTAIYLSTCVDELALICANCDGHPFLGDSVPAVSVAIVGALRRCLYLAQESYGFRADRLEPTDDCSAFDKVTATTKTGFPERTFDREFLTETLTHRFRIAHAPVPVQVLGNWSILGQSSQSRIADVGANIVHYGVHNVLNQPQLSFDHVRNRLAQALMIEILGSVRDAVRTVFDEGTPIRTVKTACQECLDALADTARTPTPTLLRSAYESEFFNQRTFGTRKPECYKVLTWSEPFPESDVKFSRSKWRNLHVNRKELVVFLSGRADKVPNNKRALLGWFEETISGVSGRIIDHWSNSQPRLLKSLIRVPRYRSGIGDALPAPILELGHKKKLLIVDRREIEVLREIRRELRSHITEVGRGNAEKPLCLGVFGPPGTGKNFVIERLMEQHSTSFFVPGDKAGQKEAQRPLSPLRFNLALFKGHDDLTNAFSHLTSTCKKAAAVDKLVLAIFDEFDSSAPGNEWRGWLRFFLSPMEDGKLEGVDISRAVLVFAGGTSRTLSEFSLSENDPKWIEFCERKGPDFVSRLKRPLDVVGINPTHADDELYVIRRAILLRSLLSQIQRRKREEEEWVARIDEHILHALLFVPTYLHGGRAMQQLVKMCLSDDGGISASSVPPIQHLNPFVDGKAFMGLIEASRWQSRRFTSQ